MLNQGTAIASLWVEVTNVTNPIDHPEQFLPEATLDQFLLMARLELKRAERYRVFVSMASLNVRPLLTGDDLSGVSLIADKVSKALRACDLVTFSNDGLLSVLFPETSKQGAESAVRRITAALQAEQPADQQPITTELASFPDATGTRTLAEYLSDLANRRMN